jgi:hypothetical protein
MLRARCASAALALLSAVAEPGLAQTRPATYAEFTTSVASSDGAALKQAIVGGAVAAIYLQRGEYVLDNPVVIDRTTSLFIHGAERNGTILIAKDPSQPLIVIKNAPLVNFAGVRLHPTKNIPWPNALAITTANTQPSSVEFQDCFVDRATLVFAGPGTLRVQSCYFSPLGKARAAVIVDHPGADALIIGGDISNGGTPLAVDSYVHLWQKRGRLRVYSTTLEGALGRADVRIDTASALGPHVIAGVRSEGVNGALLHTGISRLLYVPPTSEKVDVVLKVDGGAWMTGPETSNQQDRVNCRLVDYNGAGTLWLLGNRGEYCIRHLVEGNAPLAEIVSIGNLIGSPQPFPVVARRVVTSLDLFAYYLWNNLQVYPWTRWIPDASVPPKLASYGAVPLPPRDSLPAFLGRPRMTAALPGMIDVKAAPYGAKGDGVTDDTNRIQLALDANCTNTTPKQIYFPAGTYRITRTLYLNHRSGGACHGVLPFGGWIAGAGSANTRIEMAPNVKQGVFATDSLAYATVQGITFKTFAWQAGDPREPNVDFSAYSGPGYMATQQDDLYDVVFDGGWAGFGAGVRPPYSIQCSSMAIYQGKFQNAGIGFVSGHYNALSNLVADAQFTNNDYAMGARTMDSAAMSAGGDFHAYRAVSRGTRTADFLFGGSPLGNTWYFYEWDSDAPAYVSLLGGTSVAYPMLFEGAALAPRDGTANPFNLYTAQGPIFLYSAVTRAGIRIGESPLGQGYAVNLASQIPDWSSTALGSWGQQDQLASAPAESTPAALGVPGKPTVVY